MSTNELLKYLPESVATMLANYCDENGLTEAQVVEYALCYFLSMDASSFYSKRLVPPAILAEENACLRLKLEQLQEEMASTKSQKGNDPPN